MADDTKAEPGDVVDVTDAAQIDALKAENEALRSQMASQQQERGPLWRRILAGVLAVVAIIAVVSAVDALWLKTTLENEDQFVSTFQPIPQDDAVATALSVRIADGVIEAQGVEAFVTETLPPELGALAVPITNSVRDVIARAANEVIQSDAVTTVWTVALRGSHVAVSAVLSGNDRALESENGVVSINLDEIAGVVVERVEERGLNLPDVDIELGSVVIYESDDLAAAQTVAQGISTIGWLLPFIAIALIAAAIAVSTNRRWMVAFLSFASAIALLFSLAGLRIARDAIVGGIENDLEADAAAAVWDTTLARLTGGTWALIVLALIVGFIAWAAGPSKRAAGVRSWSATTVGSWRRPAQDEPSGFTRFLTEWKRTIQVVLVVLGLLFVLFGPSPSGLLVIVTALIVLGLVVLVEVMAGPAQVPAEQLEEVDA